MSGKSDKYIRLYSQIEKQLGICDNPVSRMATVNAILYHKMQNFFWVGFYLLYNHRLMVGPYQGSLACQELAKDKGVCWHAINSQKVIVVPDVDKFPGHIACDSRSRSEIAIPVYNQKGIIVGVMDIDSDKPDSFDMTDAEYLEKIVKLIYQAQTG